MSPSMPLPFLFTDILYLIARILSRTFYQFNEYSALTQCGFVDNVHGEIRSPATPVSAEKRRYIRQDGVYPDSDISTVVHELIHWQDAQKYQTKYGAIKTSKDYKEFSESLGKSHKNALDKIGVTEYNVSDISKYANDMYMQEIYNETYTEYRTRKVLSEKE